MIHLDLKSIQQVYFYNFLKKILENSFKNYWRFLNIPFPNLITNFISLYHMYGPYLSCQYLLVCDISEKSFITFLQELEQKVIKRKRLTPQNFFNWRNKPLMNQHDKGVKMRILPNVKETLYSYHKIHWLIVALLVSLFQAFSTYLNWIKEVFIHFSKRNLYSQFSSINIL